MYKQTLEKTLFVRSLLELRVYRTGDGAGKQFAFIFASFVFC